jgi:hypothetical protein
MQGDENQIPLCCFNRLYSYFRKASYGLLNILFLFSNCFFLAAGFLVAVA